MAMVLGNCPACGVRFSARPSALNVLWRCPACGHTCILTREIAPDYNGPSAGFLIAVVIIMLIVTLIAVSGFHGRG